MLLGIYDDLLFAAALGTTTKYKLLLTGEPAIAGGAPSVVQTNDLTTFRTGALPWGGLSESVAAGNELIVAVGVEVNATWVGGQFVLAVSSDGGQTFTRHPHPQGGRIAYYGGGSIAFGRGLFVLVAPNTSGFFSVHTSPDGVVWTQRASPFVGTATARFVNGVFFLHGFDTVNNVAAYATSIDGVSYARRPNIWPAVTSTVIDYEASVPGAYGSAPITSVDYANGFWVLGAHAHAGNVEIAYSADLDNFTKQALPWGNDVATASANVGGVTFFNGRYFAVGASGTAPYKQIATSADLRSWAKLANPLDAGGVKLLLNMGDRLVVIVTTGYPLDQVFWDGEGGSTYSPTATPVYAAFVTTDGVSFARATLPAVFWKVTSGKLV